MGGAENGGLSYVPSYRFGSPQASMKLLGVVPIVLEELLGLIEGALSRRFYFEEAVVLFILGLLDDLSALIYLVKLLGHPSYALVLNGQRPKDGTQRVSCKACRGRWSCLVRC